MNGLSVQAAKECVLALHDGVKFGEWTDHEGGIIPGTVSGLVRALNSGKC
jgi:hypothetical protein